MKHSPVVDPGFSEGNAEETPIGKYFDSFLTNRVTIINTISAHKLFLRVPIF